MGRDAGDGLELPRPGAERVLLGRFQPRALPAEALGVVGLRARPLGQEVPGAGREHDAGHDHHQRDADRREREHLPGIRAQTQHEPQHQQAEPEVQPRTARVGEQHARQQDAEQRELGR